jgi:hypothetical protein
VGLSTRSKTSIFKQLRMLIATTASEFENFFARCGEEFAEPGGPDMGRITQIGVEHGIHFVQD